MSKFDWKNIDFDAGEDQPKGSRFSKKEQKQPKLTDKKNKKKGQ
jgi:hypothetical protein